MRERRRPRAVAVCYVLATCAVAAAVGLVATALGHGRNAALILLAAPALGALGALTLAWARRAGADGLSPGDASEDHQPPSPEALSSQQAEQV